MRIKKLSGQNLQIFKQEYVFNYKSAVSKSTKQNQTAMNYIMSINAATFVNLPNNL